MDQDILRTDVDDFINLVKDKEKIDLGTAAKLLHVDERTIEAWADFLVEERILGIEYKFTTPYVFINSEKHKTASDNFDFETKEEFFIKAKQKNIPDYQAKILWLKYLTVNERKIKAAFFGRCKSRGISNEKTEDLWKKYYLQLKTD